MSEPATIEPDGPALPGRTVMAQWWLDAVFVHWPVDPDRVAPLLPAGTRPDVHDGAAWVGLVPFRMRGAGPGDRLRVPWLGDFLETNVRTYAVDDEGRRGVVFRSLDCARLGIVLGARAAFGTPYHWAAMGFAATGGEGEGRVVTYRSRRRSRPWGAADRVRVRFGERLPEPSPLEHFLTARFGLHTRHAGRTLWVPNTHTAWPLHRAELLDLDDELVAAAGWPGVAGGPPASVLCSPGVRTRFGAPVSLGSAPPAGR